jgi:hypothetical protein
VQNSNKLECGPVDTEDVVRHSGYNSLMYVNEGGYGTDVYLVGGIAGGGTELAEVGRTSARS